MPFGTTPSRWRVYQFHHQGNYNCGLRTEPAIADYLTDANGKPLTAISYGADGGRTRDLSSDSRVL